MWCYFDWDARARFAKAQVLELKLLYREALEYYTKAVQLAPANTTYLNELGKMHHTLGDYDQAIAYHEKALASDLKTLGPQHPDVAIRWNWSCPEIVDTSETHDHLRPPGS